jgi:hypothetical protein
VVAKGGWLIEREEHRTVGEYLTEKILLPCPLGGRF